MPAKGTVTVKPKKADLKFCVVGFYDDGSPCESRYAADVEEATTIASKLARSMVIVQVYEKKFKAEIPTVSLIKAC